MLMLKVGSLFAGIGGIELGLEMTGGFETVWQVENNDYARRVLERHWPNVRRWGDVTTFLADADGDALREQQELCGQQKSCGAAKGRPAELGHDGQDWRADLICGGFPCQPVSCAGKRAGESDKRWLWDEMRRVCQILRPRWILVENVPGLMSAGAFRGELMGKVLRDLAALVADCGGGWVRSNCIPVASVGAPHIRDRVFILAHTLRPECESGAGGRGVRQGDSEVAHTQGRGTAAGQQPRQLHGAEQGGEDLADAQQHGLQGGTIHAGHRGLPRDAWWSTEPDVGRVADGVPSRVDRLKCLGNAVVPQVARWIGEMILAMEHKPLAPNP